MTNEFSRIRTCGRRQADECIAGPAAAAWCARRRETEAKVAAGGRDQAGSIAIASKMKFGLRNVAPLLPLSTEIESVFVPTFSALAGTVKV